MNIEKLKYFIDLVECQNFTDTAKKNYVSQATVSQQIASLEKEFDLLLVDRKKIPVEPTPAGRLFYEEATALWKQYHKMKQKMEGYKQGYPQTLNIEYASTTDIELLLKLIPPFQKMYPDIKIQVTKVLLKDIADYLNKEIYDLAIAIDSEFEDAKNIFTQPFYVGKYCAVVSSEHALADRNELTLEELYQYPLIMMNAQHIGHSYYKMIERAIAEGFYPNIVRNVDDVETELFYIVTEHLIGFFPDNYQSTYLNQNIRLIPIKDTHHKFQIVAGYRKDNSNSSLRLFLKYVKDSFL